MVHMTMDIATALAQGGIAEALPVWVEQSPSIRFETATGA